MSTALENLRCQVVTEGECGVLCLLCPLGVCEAQSELHVAVEGDPDVEAGGCISFWEAEVIDSEGHPHGLRPVCDLLAHHPQADVEVLLEHPCDDLHARDDPSDCLLEVAVLLGLQPAAQVHAAHGHEDRVLRGQEAGGGGQPLKTVKPAHPPEVQLGAVQLRGSHLVSLLLSLVFTGFTSLVSRTTGVSRTATTCFSGGRGGGVFKGMHCMWAVD